MSLTKVLIVDDREENLLVLEMVLSPCNLELVRAKSGNEALQKMLDHDFALVLMDVQMPGMDGFETVEIMKSNKSLKMIPVIFISAIYREDSHLLRSIESGGVDFIIKPIIPEILVGKVRVFVQLHEDREKLRVLNDSLEWELFVSESLGELANQVVSPDFSMDRMEKIVREISLNITKSQWVALLDTPPQKERGEKSVILTEVKEQPKELSIPNEHPTLENILSVPVLFNHICIGQITLANRKNPYEEKHVKAIQKVANLFALSLQKVKEEEDRKKMEAELRQSDKMQAIGQIAGGIAHDFNNQLSMIMGTAELCLSEVPQNKSLSEKLESIIDVSSRAGQLTRQLLNYSRKGFYSNRVIDPHIIIKEVVSVLERTIDKRITLSLELEEKKVRINGDATQLYTAILNICINARDAMPLGGKITIRSHTEVIQKGMSAYDEKEVYPGIYLIITISDTGVGIKKDVFKKMFDPFYTTKELGQGTGMGLSAVLGIVKRHNGFLLVKSQEGEGTHFSIYLPLLIV